MSKLSKKKRDRSAVLPKQLRAFHKSRRPDVVRILPVELALFFTKVEKVLSNSSPHFVVATYDVPSQKCENLYLRPWCKFYSNIGRILREVVPLAPGNYKTGKTYLSAHCLVATATAT